MHVAAANPLALDESGIDPEVIERERAIAREKAAGSGKPVEIIEKMIDGGVRKFVGESTLLGQVFVLDGKPKIAEVLAKASKVMGAPVSAPAFVSFTLGEGSDREASEFAAAVGK